MIGDLRKVATVAGVECFSVDGSGFWFISKSWSDHLRGKGDAYFARHFEEECQAIGSTFEGFAPLAKAAVEERWTLGPLYVPDKLDAHAEWVSRDTLEEATIKYVAKSAGEGRRIHLQHDDRGADVRAGTWEEIVCWPHETTAKVRHGGVERQVKMSAGAVYVGVRWDPSFWRDGAPYDPIAKKRLNGYSLGGKATKVKGAAGAPMLYMGKARHDLREPSTGRFASEADFRMMIGDWEIANPSSAHPALLAQARRTPKT